MGVSGPLAVPQTSVAHSSRRGAALGMSPHSPAGWRVGQHGRPTSRLAVPSRKLIQHHLCRLPPARDHVKRPGRASADLRQPVPIAAQDLGSGITHPLASQRQAGRQGFHGGTQCTKSPTSMVLASAFVRPPTSPQSPSVVVFHYHGNLRKGSVTPCEPVIVKRTNIGKVFLP